MKVDSGVMWGGGCEGGWIANSNLLGRWQAEEVPSVVPKPLRSAGQWVREHASALRAAKQVLWVAGKVQHTAERESTAAQQSKVHYSHQRDPEHDNPCGQGLLLGCH